MISSTATAEDLELMRARIRVALELAIGNGPVQAHRALDQVAPAVGLGSGEIDALFFQARAIAHIKARAIAEGFEAFERAVLAARADGEPGLCARVLLNYGSALVQDGNVALAVACLEEALELSRGVEAAAKPFVLVSLAETLLAAGELRRAAALLVELQSTGEGTTRTSLVAAAAAIPLGMMLGEEALLKPSCDPSLLDLAFALPEQGLLGPLVESFCALYEQRGWRARHDALLDRSLATLSVLDNSLLLGIRAARLGRPEHLPRVSGLMARQCGVGTSAFLRAHQDLFDSFVSARRRIPERAKELALQAEAEFARAGRPLLQALALDAAGLASQARELRAKSGARTDALLPVWRGTPIHKRLATALTPRESEVARLAARGLTNRAIATALGLSERTVHHHCEAVFSKLGIRSRWQLARELGSDIGKLPTRPRRRT
ncbi:MAG TPA: helix-turn-helix transcriptional regulator [Candidatus Cybelea sp.]